ncbi:hypothetical protein SAMN02745165_00989 [Malonomonas rubra DSM 5091]|uniref:Uncharacterized protein n=1 Tax=Malonomonas rubra DSM 5091 TaxID=1122189 RepID=A0A1M6E9P0_MALRU|nr:hypothetical protein [Malonomonas rubra]SHI81998.1 hypothetical protein SAMN02745165_00989 [Malonomonas rubra DSM 5091]
MKKVTLLLVCGLVLLAAGSVFAKSEWAKYQVNPVPDDVNVPKVALDENTGLLNCCFCHGPDVKHAGPQLPYCAEGE